MAATTQPPHDDKPSFLLWGALGLAMLLVTGVVAYGAIALLGDDAADASYPDSWDARVEPFARAVEAQRGLQFAHPVAVEFLSAKEYDAAVADELAPIEEWRAQLVGDSALLQAVGLIDLGLEPAGRRQPARCRRRGPRHRELLLRGRTHPHPRHQGHPDRAGPAGARAHACPPGPAVRHRQPAGDAEPAAGPGPRRRPAGGRRGRRPAHRGRLAEDPAPQAAPRRRPGLGRDDTCDGEEDSGRSPRSCR